MAANLHKRCRVSVQAQPFDVRDCSFPRPCLATYSRPLLNGASVCSYDLSYTKAPARFRAAHALLHESLIGQHDGCCSVSFVQLTGNSYKQYTSTACLDRNGSSYTCDAVRRNWISQALASRSLVKSLPGAKHDISVVKICHHDHCIDNLQKIRH